MNDDELEEEEESDSDKPLEVENKLDPRQRLAWNYYIDRDSETFGNAAGSALKAGFGPAYSQCITRVQWWKDKKRRTHLLGYAEKVLKKAMVMETVNENGKNDPALVRVAVDAAKHVTKTLGKDEGYSERIDNSGQGSNTVFLPIELMEKFHLGKETKEEPKKEDETIINK